MSLIITGFNTSSETKFYLACPKCGKKNEFGVLKFLDAINRHKEITCVVCNNEFYVELNCSIRDAELHVHPTEAGGAIEWVCENCKPDINLNLSNCVICGTPRLGG